ncbi:MAG: hypothetical protein V2I43_29410 [Parvularcula sp.]|jgi:hypothetical protein|nr:hypothetical protein [Parvularcula sp.]
MRLAPTLLLHECRIVLRYRIALAAVFAVAGYGVLFVLVGQRMNAGAIAFLIFSDPAMLGFAFAGLLMMTERQQGADLQMALSGVTIFQRFAYRAAVLGLLAVVAATMMAVLFIGVRHWAAFMIATLSISVTYSAIGMAVAQRTQRVTAFFAVAGFVLLPVLASALLAFANTAIGPYWPFAAQLFALRSALAGPADPHDPGGIMLIVSMATALVCLLAAAHLGRRRLAA